MANPLFGAQLLIGDLSRELASDDPPQRFLVEHGDLGRLESVTTIPALRSALNVMDAWDGAAKTARAWSPLGLRPFELMPAKGQLVALYEAGFTVLLEDIERFVPELVPLCRSLEADLGLKPGRVNVEVFCARKGAVGRAHFDSGFTFNCQIAGTKSWRLAPNPALAFPPRGVGMFLGRPTPAALTPFLHGTPPASIEGLEGGETVITQPGSVVFVAPGVLHQTEMVTDSYAIAFAIEQTDCIATQVSGLIEALLLKTPSLRAARLGAQTRDLTEEGTYVAAALRQLADALESGETSCWGEPEPRHRLRLGLQVERAENGSLRLKTASRERLLTIAPDLAELLLWASQRDSFRVDDVAREVPLRNLSSADQCISQLVQTGLLEPILPEPIDESS